MTDDGKLPAQLCSKPMLVRLRKGGLAEGLDRVRACSPPPTQFAALHDILD